MDSNYLKLMAGDDVFLMSKRIIDQAWDAGKAARKIGGRDELLQTVSEILLKVLAGKAIFDSTRGVSFYGFVMEKARWIAFGGNWMLEAPSIRRPEPAQPATPDDIGEEEVGDDVKVELLPMQTVTARAGGSDAQAESDIKLDEPAAPAAWWVPGLLDCSGDEDDDTQLTPVHNLLKYADSTALAVLLGCTPRTIGNMLCRAKNRQEIAKKPARPKIYFKK